MWNASASPRGGVHVVMDETAIVAAGTGNILAAWLINAHERPLQPRSRTTTADPARQHVGIL